MNEKNSVSLKMASLINGGAKYTNIIFNLLFSIILARLLSPEDFGVVAITTVFTNFFTLFSDMGIGAAVIQNKFLERNDINKIFSFTLLLGVTLGAAFFLFSFALVRIYNNGVYVGIGAALGISIALVTFNVVPNAVLMKEKRFLLVAVRTIVSNLIGYISALFLAINGGKSYSIVCQSVVTGLICFGWNIAGAKIGLDFRNMTASMNKIRRFSFFQMAFNFLNYFSRNIDNLLVGYYFGDKQIGYYDKSYRLMRYPVSGFTDILVPSILPILSEYQNEKNYIVEKYFQFIKLLSLIAIYVSCICFFAPREIVLLFFGSQWEGAVASFKILSLTVWAQMVSGITGSFYQCLDRTKYLFYSGLQNIFIVLPLIFLGVHLGSIEALASCYAIGFTCSFIRGQWYLARYCLDIPASNTFKQYIPEMIITIILFGVMRFVNPREDLLVNFIIKGGAAFIIYFVLLVLSKEYKHLLVLLPAKVRERFR